MKPGNYRRSDLKWIGNRVVYGSTTLLEIVPDQQWPSMWRIKFPDGRVTDMVNRTRARDGATEIAVALLNQKHPGHVARSPPSDFSEGAATTLADRT